MPQTEPTKDIQPAPILTVEECSEDQLLLLEIIDLQTKFNNKTNGECWLDGITKDGNPIDWYRCMRMEAMELIDCYPWKHWKDLSAKPNIENARMEIVDIMHFLTSEAVRYVTDSPMEMLQLVDVWTDNQHVDVEAYNKLSDIELYEAFIRTTSTNDIGSASDVFWLMLPRVGMNIKSLRDLYISKNVLNQFRQANGYKEGTYVKVWSGLEDNEVLAKIVKADPHLTFAELMEELDEAYDLLVKVGQK